MSFGVREKLFLVSLFLILSVGLAVGLYLEHQLRSWLETRIETELLHYAESARTLLELAQEDRIEQADPIADHLGAATESRITIIAEDGQVIGDSELTRTEVAAVENHGQRPEVLAALGKGIGVNRRHSTTLGTDMLYVAIPYGRPSPHGTVRAAMALEDVDRVLRELRFHLLFAGVLGLVIAVFMSGLASHWLTRTLRSLLAHAHSISQRAELPAPPRQDDIQGLAGSFQHLAEALERQMSNLAEERDRSQAILECMSEALFALDERQRITMVNQAALDLLDLRVPPFGQTLSQVTGVESLEQVVGAAMQGSVVSSEFGLAAPSLRSILARAAPQRISGGCVVVMHDITEIRNMESFLRDFVANASHELRTPVSVIRANAETLLDSGPADPQIAQRMLETLHRNAERLASIVSDLLDLSRLDARELRMQPVPIPIAQTVQRVCETLDAVTRDKDLRLDVDVGPDTVARADEKALDQVLLNLLDNALKYTPRGGRISVRARRENDRIRVQVCDTGPGIPPEHRERVFERFYRVDVGRSRDMGGTGLGLSIVKSLVHAMGGEVGMDPRSPHGASFWFTVPAAQAEPAPGA